MAATQRESAWVVFLKAEEWEAGKREGGKRGREGGRGASPLDLPHLKPELGVLLDMGLDKPGRGLELGSRERVEGVRCRLG